MADKKIPEAKSGGKKAKPEGGSYETYLTGLSERFPKATGKQLADKKYISKDYSDTYDDFYANWGDSPDPKGGPQMTGNPIKKMESNAQERSNLLNINPLSKHMSTPFSMGGSSSILMGHSPNEMGHSPNEMKGSPNHQETDPKDGKKKPTTMQKVRNTLEPGLSKNQTGNSRQQLFDYDGDGDTIFSDSNRDGTMLSRAINSFRQGAKSSDRQAGASADLQDRINNRFIQDVKGKGLIQAIKQNFRF